MFAGRTAKAAVLSVSAVICVATLAVTVGLAHAATGVGASGNTITNALQAQTPFSPGTLDSGQPVDVVVPANSVLTPGNAIFVLECAAPNGVDPTTINSCDGNTGYAGGTITVNADGSIDVINSSTNSGFPYTIYALPDQITLGEGSSNLPKCGLGSANECVLYIGQGGGSDTGLSQPHFFSQAFQVHPDPTDSGTLNPGDGTFPADSAPAITSANHATFTQGSAGTFSVTATGYGPPTFTETGTLPTGVTLKTTFSGNSSTGVLAGTPTQSGSFPITFTATNGVGSPASQSFTLMVNTSGTAPAITSANHATFTEGSAGTFTVTATGSPTPTLAESGTLPTGVTFTASTGVLAGTPTQSGTFPITFTATNGVGSPASQPFTLTVNGSGTAPAITSANHATFTEGSAGTFTVTATGSPTPTLAETGALPTGVTFMASTGVLAGTPTQSGTFPITFTATNGVGSPASQSFTLTVDAAPTITSADNTTFTEDTAGTFTVTATGFPAPTFSEAGTLPTGVLFSSAGVLSGTPTQNGSFPFTITATNGVGSPAMQSFTLTVNTSGTAPAITSANHATFTEGSAGTFTVTATGSPTPTLAETGTLPTGVAFTASTGVLAGTPTQSGTFPITFTATNGVGSPASQSFTLTVNTSGTAPAITSANHATFTEGSAGTFTVTATGSPTPTLAETGTLPTGVTFTASTGVLAGTPTQSGTFPITFTANNGVGSPASQSFTLTVNGGGVGATITLHRTSGLIGHDSDEISGSGWTADTTVTLSECASPTFVSSLCDSSNQVIVNPRTGGKAGTFSAAHLVIDVGMVGSKKHTCGLASSGQCFIIASGSTGDSASSGPLGFSIPSLTAKHTTSVLANTADQLKASGFPIGDSVVAQECDQHVHVPKTVATHCDPATSIFGGASNHGKVTFSPTGITLLVGSAYTDAAHRQCLAGGTCEIVVTDSDNSAIGLEVAVTFSTPTVSLKTTSNVPANFKDPVQAAGFPAGDSVSAQECDQAVHVPKTLATHCDGTTAIAGTASNKGKVAFSPKAVTLLVGSAYSDSSHHGCPAGGTCEIVVTDSDNPTVGLEVPVGFS